MYPHRKSPPSSPSDLLQVLEELHADPAPPDAAERLRSLDAQVEELTLELRALRRQRRLVVLAMGRVPKWVRRLFGAERLLRRADAIQSRRHLQ